MQLPPMEPGGYSGLRENGRAKPLVVKLIGLWLIAMGAVIAFPSAFHPGVIHRALSPGVHATLLVVGGVAAAAGFALVVAGFRRARSAHIPSLKA